MCHESGVLPGTRVGGHIEQVPARLHLYRFYQCLPECEVNHSLLLHKLEKVYDIDGDALQWLISYLGRRRQRVVLNGKVSEWVPVLSGTPEGGHISPLLFALYVNDLPTVISTNCLLFADDLKLFHEIRSDEDVHALQQDLDAVTRWAADWKLKLNASKCKSFNITLKAKLLTRHTLSIPPLWKTLHVFEISASFSTKNWISQTT